MFISLVPSCSMCAPLLAQHFYAVHYTNGFESPSHCLLKSTWFRRRGLYVCVTFWHSVSLLEQTAVMNEQVAVAVSHRRVRLSWSRPGWARSSYTRAPSNLARLCLEWYICGSWPQPQTCISISSHSKVVKTGLTWFWGSTNGLWGFRCSFKKLANSEGWTLCAFNQVAFNCKAHTDTLMITF